MSFDETDVRRAFAEGEFYPVFQPLVEFRTGQLAGFEVLARWKHGKLGQIVPDAFIPALERAGQIDKLTQVVLERAFSEAAALGQRVSLHINISPLQLVDFELPGRIAAAAAQGKFSLEALTIEITESALVDDLLRAQAVAQELKALGCRLALDDFGTGYSSLKHLNALPFDELKVDRSFVRSMTEQRDSRKIVASVVGLGQSLGLTTVAEGVETAEQANMLRSMGCEIGQGWLFGRPVPAEELAEVIGRLRREGSMHAALPVDQNPIISLEALPAQRLAQLQAIYDGVPVGICFLDRNLRYVSLNRQLAQMNGIPASAHLGKTVAEVIPIVFPRVEPFIRRAMQGEPISGVEIQRLRGNEVGGSPVVVASYQPAYDEGGEVVGVSVALMDITGSKRTEEALRESENHYRHMVQLSPHVPWVLDGKGEVKEASPRWESVTGQALGDALGNGWLRMLHPDDVAPTRRAIENAIHHGDPIDIEYRVSRPDGEWIWMRSRGSPRFGPSGEVISVYGVVEEVHGHRQISEELEACHTELTAAVNAVPIGIVLSDARDGTIFMVNPEAQRIFRGMVFAGQTLAECGRLTLTRTDGGVDEPAQFPLVRAILHGETVEGMQARFRRPDGTDIAVELSSKSIRADNGVLVGGIMLARSMELGERSDKGSAIGSSEGGPRTATLSSATLR